MRPAMAVLQEGRRRELGQALFYRLLSAGAERAGDAAAAERLNGLLADEQHHVARLTARILELGGQPERVEQSPADVTSLEMWEAEARRREAEEVAWYERALGGVQDPGTRSVLEEILGSERHHQEGLEGKWMPAGPTKAMEDM